MKKKSAFILLYGKIIVLYSVIKRYNLIEVFLYHLVVKKNSGQLSSSLQMHVISMGVCAHMLQSSIRHFMLLDDIMRMCGALTVIFVEARMGCMA